MSEQLDRLVRPEGCHLGQGNCGIVALAAATGIPYQEVWDWFRARKPGNWKGGTRHSERERFLQENQVPFYPALREAERGMTLQRWVRSCTKPGRTYLVTTTGHVQVVRDGRVLDQNVPEGVPVSIYRCRRKRMRGALSIHP